MKLISRFFHSVRLSLMILLLTRALASSSCILPNPQRISSVFYSTEVLSFLESTTSSMPISISSSNYMVFMSASISSRCCFSCAKGICRSGEWATSGATDSCDFPLDGCLATGIHRKTKVVASTIAMNMLNGLRWLWCSMFIYSMFSRRREVKKITPT